MFNVGTPELLVILVVALVVLGPTRLPDAARQIGRALGELRRVSSDFQAEMRDAMIEPPSAPPADGASAEPEPPSIAPVTGGDTTTGAMATDGRRPARSRRTRPLQARD